MSAEAAWWPAIDTAARAQENLADRLSLSVLPTCAMSPSRAGILCGVPAHAAGDALCAGHRRCRPVRCGAAGYQQGAGYRARRHLAQRDARTGHPAVVGAGERVLTLVNDTEIIVDGERGRVIPALAERRSRTELRLKEHEEAAPSATRGPGWPPCRGRRQPGQHGPRRMPSNAAPSGGTAAYRIRVHGASRRPDLDTQIAEYRQAIDALDGRPLVARMLDVGGDKRLPYWPLPCGRQSVPRLARHRLA